MSFWPRLEADRQSLAAPASARRARTPNSSTCQWLSDAMRREGLIWDDGPMSASTPTAPTRTMKPPPSVRAIKEGDFLLIDIWARPNQARHHLLRHHMDRSGGARASERETLVFNTVVMPASGPSMRSRAPLPRTARSAASRLDDAGLAPSFAGWLR